MNDQNKHFRQSPSRQRRDTSQLRQTDETRPSNSQPTPDDAMVYQPLDSILCRMSLCELLQTFVCVPLDHHHQRIIYINTLCLSIYLRNEILRHHITTTMTTAGHTNTHWCNNHNINSPLLVLRVGGGGEGKVGGNNNCEGIFRTETDMWVNAWTRRATGITINLPTGDWLRWMIIAIGMILKKIEMRRGRVIYFATMMIALQLT